MILYLLVNGLLGEESHDAVRSKEDKGKCYKYAEEGSYIKVRAEMSSYYIAEYRVCF